MRCAFSCFAMLLCASAFADPPKDKTKPEDDVSYKVLKETKIPAGGFSRVVIVDAKLVNEKSMRALGDKFAKDTKDDNQANIHVFRNEKAAQLRIDSNAGKNLSKSNSEFMEKHHVGIFLKNKSSGKHEFQIMLKGLDGPTTTVEY